MVFPLAATLTLIPEEFGPGKININLVVDTVVGSVIKHISMGKKYGVAVVAEGVAEKIDPNTLPEIEGAERDAEGNIRYREFDFGGILRCKVRERLEELGIDIGVVDKNVGYELRAGAPNSFDRQFTRELGCGVVECLVEDGCAGMISKVEDELVMQPLNEQVDSKTGLTKIRYVSLNSAVYRVA